MMGFTLINGLMFGIEHITGEDEDVFDYIIEVNFLIFRAAWMKLKDGYEFED